MLPKPVIEREVTRQPAVAFLGVLEGHHKGQFLAERQDKALRTSVSAGRVKLGTDELEAKGFKGLG